MNESELTRPLSRTERKKLRQRRQAEESQSQKSRWLRFVIAFARGCAGALGFAVALGGLLSFFPAFSVSREPLLRPPDALSGFFVIEYESLIPVADVDPICYATRLTNASGGGIATLGIDIARLRVPFMWQGDEITVPCAFAEAIKQPPIIHGDITLSIRYRPLLIPAFVHWTWRKEFRFITASQSDGSPRWLPEPQNYKP
jgi:hypothetical protein